MRDYELLAEIKGIISPLRRLYQKYHENTTNVDYFNEQVKRAIVLDVQWTIDSLETLETEFLKLIAVKHKFMDKVEDYEPWEEKVKKKFQLRELNEAEEIYYATKKTTWQQYCFFVSMFVVVRNGDFHALVAAPNDGGKTNTALMILREINRNYRNFWMLQPRYREKIQPWQPDYLEKHPELKGQQLMKWSIRRDVMVKPSGDQIARRLEIEQYRCIDINEPMEAATNLQSMDRKVIQMGVKRYTTRSQHNALLYEYQVAKRPTALMLEGMNCWFNKMGLRWMVISMASHLYRRTDPYYMIEADKCRGDRAFSKWMVGKGENGNPNYIIKCRAPKMPLFMESQFERFYKTEQDKERQEQEDKNALDLRYMNEIKIFWQQIEDEDIAYMDLPRILQEDYKFNANQIRKFMREFDKYDAIQKMMKMRIRNKEIA